MFGIFSGYLNNGIRVVLHQIKDCQMMACGIWIKQGSKYETDANNGISHLIEHFVVNRNNKCNPLLQQQLKNLSARGIRYNAATTKETTSFYFLGLNENLKICLETLHNIVVDNRDFDDEMIENEKSIVLRELTSFYSSFNQIKERTTQALYGNMDIGRIILGDKDVINDISKAEIIDILNKSYTPENATIVVIGDIDYEETIQYIADMFNDWEDKDTQNYAEMIEATPGIFYSNRSKDNAVTSIGFRLPRLDIQSELALEAAVTMIGDPLAGGRLITELRDKRGLAYNVGGFAAVYEECGTLGITSVVNCNNVEEVLKIKMEILRDIIDNGFTQEELDKACMAIHTRRLLELRDLSAQLKFLGKYSLNGFIYSLENEIRQINKLSLSDINNFIKSVVNNDNMGLALIGDCNMDSVIEVLKL